MDLNRPSDAARSGQSAASQAEALGQLVGQLAHDINNLLATALVGVELAAQSVGDEKAQNLLAGAVRTMGRQRELTEAMARAARAGGEEECLDVHELLAACRGELESELDPARLDLRLEAAQAKVCCNATFLRRALLHIAANARASMHNRGRLLIATCNRAPAAAGTSPAGDVLLLTASDDGDGMPEHVKSRAFDLFYSTREGAAGIGLAQVRDTLRRAGGTALLESATGRGTAIHLTFPLARQSEPHGTIF